MCLLWFPAPGKRKGIALVPLQAVDSFRDKGNTEKTDAEYKAIP
jgi:hypothetical protein